MQPNPFAGYTEDDIELLMRKAGRSPAGAMSALDSAGGGAATAPTPAVEPKPTITPPASRQPVVLKKKPQQAAPVAQAPAPTPAIDDPMRPLGSTGLRPNEDLREALKKLEQDKTIKTNTLLPIREMKLRELAGQDSEAYRMQGQSVDEMRALLEQRLGQKTQTNLKPLAALMDSWYGSKLAAGYTEPETAAGKLDKIAAYQAQIAGQRDKMVDNLTNYQKNFKDGGSITDKLAELFQLQQKTGTRAFDPNSALRGTATQQRLLDKDLRGEINRDILNPMALRKEQFATIDSSLASNDYQTVHSMLSQFSRGVAGEKGVLTDTDIKRIIPASFGGDLARFMAYFGSTPTEKLDPNYTLKLRELVSTAKSNAVVVYGDHVKNKKALFKAMPSYNGQDAAINEAFGIADEAVKSFGVPAPQANSSTGPMGDIDAWGREYDAKNAGKL